MYFDQFTGPELFTPNHLKSSPALRPSTVRDRKLEAGNLMV